MNTETWCYGEYPSPEAISVGCFGAVHAKGLAFRVSVLCTSPGRSGNLTAEFAEAFHRYMEIRRRKDGAVAMICYNVPLGLCSDWPDWRRHFAEELADVPDDWRDAKVVWTNKEQNIAEENKNE